MSRSFFMEIRGTEREVVIDRDYGPESDTGAHDVDWHVEGPDDLTEKENEIVAARVYDFLYENYGSDLDDR